jgi:hypothetical protein
VDYREAVDPLIHRDIWQGNSFFDWSNPIPEPAPFPEILLGDFDSAQYESDRDIGRVPTGIGNVIYSNVHPWALKNLACRNDFMVLGSQIFASQIYKVVVGLLLFFSYFFIGI